MSNQTLSLKSTNRTNKGYSAHQAYITRNYNAKTPIQHNIAMQGGAKCPHGFPGGGCPICMGKTGGGGGANDKKRTGMSWGEAYYVYTLIQKNLFLAREDKQLTEMTNKRIQLLEKIRSSELYQKFLAIKNRALELVADLKNAVSQLKQAVVRAVVNPLVETVNKIVNILRTSVTRLIGVANKLTALMGEKIKMMREAIKENIRKILAKLGETGFLSRLIAVFNDKRQLYQDLLLRKIESLKEKILKFSDMISFFSEEDPENQDNKKNRAKRLIKKNLKKVSEILC